MATSLLIVEDEANLRATLARELTKRGFVVSVAETVEAALDVLINAAVLRKAPIDVLVADLRLGGFDGLDLLRSIRRVSPTTRFILMSGFATVRDEQVARDLGAVEVLAKPFSLDELVAALKKAADCKTGFHGDLHGLSLVDILQMFHFGRRSVSVYVGGPQPGEIHLQDGEIVHAAVGMTMGEDALGVLLAQSAGHVRTAGLAEGLPLTIRRPFEGLLLDTLRKNDERR